MVKQTIKKRFLMQTYIKSIKMNSWILRKSLWISKLKKKRFLEMKKDLFQILMPFLINL